MLRRKSRAEPTPGRPGVWGAPPVKVLLSCLLFAGCAHSRTAEPASDGDSGASVTLRTPEAAVAAYFEAMRTLSVDALWRLMPSSARAGRSRADLEAALAKSTPEQRAETRGQHAVTPAKIGITHKGDGVRASAFYQRGQEHCELELTLDAGEWHVEVETCTSGG